MRPDQIELSAEFEREARKFAAARLEAFEQLSYAEAGKLPPAAIEDIVIENKEVQVTVFRQQGLPELGDSVLLTVQLARAGLGGVINFQHECGLVFLPDGEIRAATDRELEATGG